MDWLIPVLVISGVPKQRRAEIRELLLPVVLPGPAAHRLAFAALAANRQLDRRMQTEKDLIQEAINVAKGTANAIPNSAGLTPTLGAAFNALPAALSSTIRF